LITQKWVKNLLLCKASFNYLSPLITKETETAYEIGAMLMFSTKYGIG
jgi:hypothetical protein